MKNTQNVLVFAFACTVAGSSLAVAAGCGSSSRPDSQGEPVAKAGSGVTGATPDSVQCGAQSCPTSMIGQPCGGGDTCISAMCNPDGGLGEFPCAVCQPYCEPGTCSSNEICRDLGEERIFVPTLPPSDLCLSARFEATGCVGTIGGSGGGSCSGRPGEMTCAKCRSLCGEDNCAGLSDGCCECM